MASGWNYWVLFCLWWTWRKLITNLIYFVTIIFQSFPIGHVFRIALFVVLLWIFSQWSIQLLNGDAKTWSSVFMLEPSKYCVDDLWCPAQILLLRYPRFTVLYVPVYVSLVTCTLPLAFFIWFWAAVLLSVVQVFFILYLHILYLLPK